MNLKKQDADACPWCRRPWRCNVHAKHTKYASVKVHCPTCSEHFIMILPKHQALKMIRTSFSYPQITCTVCLQAESDGYRNDSRRPQ